VGVLPNVLGHVRNHRRGDVEFLELKQTDARFISGGPVEGVQNCGEACSAEEYLFSRGGVLAILAGEQLVVEGLVILPDELARG